jgi:hypothetical protein
MGLSKEANHQLLRGGEVKRMTVTFIH